jgi:hypothetical protein
MGSTSGLGLAEAIEQLRQELRLAQSNAAGDVQFPIQSVTVELQVVATKEAEGKAGFKVPVIELELGVGGAHSREATHRVVIELGRPVDATGMPVRVGRLSNTPLD